MLQRKICQTLLSFGRCPASPARPIFTILIPTRQTHMNKYVPVSQNVYFCFLFKIKNSKPYVYRVLQNSLSDISGHFFRVEVSFF